MISFTQRKRTYSFSPSTRIWSKKSRPSVHLSSSRSGSVKASISNHHNYYKNDSLIQVIRIGNSTYTKPQAKYLKQANSAFNCPDFPSSSPKSSNLTPSLKLPSLHKLNEKFSHINPEDSDSELKKSTDDSEITKMCTIGIGTDEEPEEKVNCISLRIKSRVHMKTFLKPKEILSPFDIFPSNLPSTYKTPEKIFVKNIRLKKLLL
jgi:hypothetical protein